MQRKKEVEAARENFLAEEQSLTFDLATMNKVAKGLGMEGAILWPVAQIDEIAPKTEVERMHAYQMLAIHGLTLRATRLAHETGGSDQRDYMRIAIEGAQAFASLSSGFHQIADRPAPE